MNEQEEKKLSSLMEKIDKLLEEGGFGDLRVQNLRAKNTPSRTCIQYKWVRRSDGTVYKKCVRYSD
ncbi:hypothetical protein [Flagellimonas sp. 2504JD1-5]